MSTGQPKRGFFFLEAINALGTAFYFNFLFFHMGAQFGWTDGGNFALSATHGFVYIFAALYAGKFAQRRGYVRALRLGFAIMAAALLAAGLLPGAATQIALLIVWTVGVCFTWPTLEGAVSDGEPPARLTRMIGIYNLTWAGGAALGYFAGGALLETLGPRSIFFVPAALHALQFALTFTLNLDRGNLSSKPAPTNTNANANANVSPENAALPPLTPRPIARTRLFLRLAWFANPFAYIAINSILPVIPSVARKLELSPMLAGFFCSIWLFARLGAFLVLWLWPGWHYRRGWFFGAYGVVMISYLAILLSANLVVLALAQLAFGLGLGLIYYSSLFYSMDLGDTKGEHGGFHEAAIGIGIFAGPAVGALALHFWPHAPNAAAWTVGAVLLAGLIGSLIIARRTSGVR